VYVRLHVLFLLFAACTLFYVTTLGLGQMSPWVVAGSMGILLASVVFHELGHYFAAVRLGGGGEEIVLGPLGGLAPMRPPHEPRAELIVHLAGPLVNLSICLVAGATLLAIEPEELKDCLNPLAPRGLIGDSGWLTGLKLTFWINWILLLANLLPAFPFDGGRVLRAMVAFLRPSDSPRQTAFIVACVAKVTAVGLLVAAYWLSREDWNPHVPVWFSLVLLAIFLYFSAKHEEDRAQDAEAEDELFGYDFSQGYTSLERSTDRHDESVGPVARWLEQRRQLRARRRKELEAEEERRVDDILMRLHEEGMENLSDEDRSLLKRVSARYRQRDEDQR
jgi:Zn-dependent protease